MDYVIPSNLYYYQELMAALRGAIEAGKLAEFIAVFESEHARSWSRRDSKEAPRG